MSWRTIAILIVFASAGVASAQMMQHGGPGMMGGGMMGPGMVGTDIPDRLPAPSSRAWLKRLEDVLALERLSKRQYTHDSWKYGVGMPYMMVEPQEENHIRLISGLFSAYGVSAEVPIPSVRTSASLGQAYMIARDLEENLIPRYEWLIANSSDPVTARVLEVILFQTRMHYRMFERALRMVGPPVN